MIKLFRCSPKLLFCCIGEWRTQLFWRIFGVIIIDTYMLGPGFVYSSLANIQATPLSLHLLTVTAVTLIICGPRLILLLMTGVSMFWVISPIVRGEMPILVADEYILFLFLPFMAACITLVVLLQENYYRPMYNQKGFNF